MPSNHISLPYCPCVGVMLINREGRVWVSEQAPECPRVDAAGSWQMPQGLVARSEPPREAGLRVLEEETGVQGVKVLAEAPGWFSYELPGDLIGVALNGKYCGERQKWLAMLFLGADEEIAAGPRNGSKVGLNAWRWAHAAEVPRLAPPLKRQLYEDVVATFAPFLDQSDAPRQPAERPWAGLLPWFIAVPR